MGKAPDVPERPEKLGSPDGKVRAVCVPNEVVLKDAHTGQELWRAKLNAPTAEGFEGLVAAPLEWTRDGKKLLLDAVGWETNSSSPQSDYYILDIATRKVQKAGTGNSAHWIPGRNAIIYSTPRDLKPLAPGNKHNIWVANLAVFDPDTGREKIITSGVTNNVSPIVCGG